MAQERQTKKSKTIAIETKDGPLYLKCVNSGRPVIVLPPGSPVRSVHGKIESTEDDFSDIDEERPEAYLLDNNGSRRRPFSFELQDTILEEDSRPSASRASTIVEGKMPGESSANNNDGANDSSSRNAQVGTAPPLPERQPPQVPQHQPVLPTPDPPETLELPPSQRASQDGGQTQGNNGGDNNGGSSNQDNVKKPARCENCGRRKKSKVVKLLLKALRMTRKPRGSPTENERSNPPMQ